MDERMKILKLLWKVGKFISLMNEVYLAKRRIAINKTSLGQNRNEEL